MGRIRVVQECKPVTARLQRNAKTQRSHKNLHCATTLRIAELRLGKGSKTRNGRYKRCSAGSTTGRAITGGTTDRACGGKTGEGNIRDVHRRFRRLDTGWTAFASKHLASPGNYNGQRVKRIRLRTKTTTVVVSSWRMEKSCRRNKGIVDGMTRFVKSGRWQVAGDRLCPLWSAVSTDGCNYSPPPSLPQIRGGVNTLPSPELGRASVGWLRSYWRFM